MKKLTEYLEKNKKSHLIFDLDETVFHLILPWEKCFLYISEELHKLDPDLHTWASKEVAHSLSKVENEFVKKHGEKVKKILIPGRIRFETENLLDVKINNELLSFIQNTNDYILHLWTSNTTEVVEPVLKKHNIHHKFSTIVTRNKVDFLKPHPEGFRKFIHQPSTSIEEYLMIGNSSADQKAANAAGIDFFLIDYFDRHH